MNKIRVVIEIEFAAESDTDAIVLPDLIVHKIRSIVAPIFARTKLVDTFVSEIPPSLKELVGGQDMPRQFLPSVHLWE
jgi:hypothetical protein